MDKRTKEQVDERIGPLGKLVMGCIYRLWKTGQTDFTERKIADYLGIERKKALEGLNILRREGLLLRGRDR